MKKVIIGLVVGLLLGSSVNTFAAVGDTVQAVFAEFNYVVNGNPKKVDSPILVYEGTSYVRTTQIANMLGYDVTYKSDSRTIEFNKPEPTPSPTQAPTATPRPTVEPTSTPDGSIVNPINATPSPSISPTQIPVTTPSPVPVSSNAAACQAIRNNYAYQIAYTKYYDPTGGSDAVRRNKVLVIEYAENTALVAAGCS